MEVVILALCILAYLSIGFLTAGLADALSSEVWFFWGDNSIFIIAWPIVIIYVIFEVFDRVGSKIIKRIAKAIRNIIE